MYKVQNQRPTFDIMAHVRKVASQSGFGLADVQESVILLPVYLKQNITSYELRFDGKAPGQDTNFIDDARFLDINDAFVMSEYGLLLGKADIVDNKPSITQTDFHAYIPGSVFAGAGEAKALKSVYSGYTTVKTDQAIRIEKQSNRILEIVPQTQANGAVRSSHDGLPTISLDSSHLFMGGQNNTVTLNLHGNVAAITPTDPAAAGYCNVALFVFKGHVIKNGNTQNFFNKWLEYTTALYR